MLAIEKRSRARRAKTAPAPAPDLRQVPLPGVTAPADGVYVEGDIATLVVKGEAWAFGLRRSPTAKRLDPEAVLRKGALVEKVDMAAAPPQGAPAAGLVLEAGLQREDFAEFFIAQKGGSLAGIVQLSKGKDGTWSASLGKSNLPAVLSEEYADAMPPDGTSALPASLAAVVPPALRFWKYKGEQAARVRAALMAEGLFNEDLVKVVDGELRLCVQRLFLYEADAGADDVLEKASLAELLAKSAPSGVRVVSNPFLEATQAQGAWQEFVSKALATDGALVVLSCPEPAALEELVDLVVSSPTRKAEWLIEFDASDDAVAEFARAGKVFKLDGVADADGRVFVSSLAFPPQFVVWADTKKRDAVSKPFAGYTDFAACVVDQKRKGYAKKAAEAICGRLQADAEKGAAREKRLKAAAKKTVTLHGLTIKIDRPKGFVQKGKDENGVEWERTYKTDYGFIPKTKGGDGEALDVFVGPEAEAKQVYWVTQTKGDGTFDEFKLFIGYAKAEDAKAEYLAHIPEKFYGGIDVTSVEMLKALLNVEPTVDLQKAVLLQKRLRVVKAEETAAEERFVLGVVLEPDIVDAQNDTYSADDVRKAAHRYMEQHRNVGLMHEGFVNDQVKIVESFIAPVDFEEGGQTVTKGTWVMGVHVLDDELWKAAKSGALGGFSIGGDAIRTPEQDA